MAGARSPSCSERGGPGCSVPGRRRAHRPLTQDKTLTRPAALAGNHHVRRRGWPSAEPPEHGDRLTGPRCRRKKPLGRETQSTVGRDAKHCGAEAAPRTPRAPGNLRGDWNRPVVIEACLELGPQGEAGKTALARKGLARQAGSKPWGCEKRKKDEKNMRRCPCRVCGSSVPSDKLRVSQVSGRGLPFPPYTGTLTSLWEGDRAQG